MKVARTERGNTRGDATKGAVLFTHFLPHKIIPLSGCILPSFDLSLTRCARDALLLKRQTWLVRAVQCECDTSSPEKEPLPLFAHPPPAADDGVNQEITHSLSSFSSRTHDCIQTKKTKPSWILNPSRNLRVVGCFFCSTSIGRQTVSSC